MAFAVPQIIVIAMMSATTSHIVASLDRETAQAKREAGKANESAAAAHERAAALEKSAEEFRLETRRADERTAVLEKDTEGLKLKAKEAERDAAVAKESAARAAIEIERLKKQSTVQGDIIAPRKISNNAKDRFFNIARGKGQSLILIAIPLQEARTFATSEVLPLLRKARFKVDVLNLEAIPKDEGIIVCDNGNGEAQLYTALTKAGIQARRIAANEKNRPTFCEPDITAYKSFRLYIGQKP